MEKDGVFYTNEELDVLRKFAGRDSDLNNSSITAIFKSKIGGNEDINRFLANNEIPYFINDGAGLKKFIGNIETLYGVACKYGASHNIPYQYLYREEQYYQDIVGNYDYRTDKPINRQWVSNSFKSFSVSRSESDAFSQGEFGSHKLMLNNFNSSNSRKIPFIDVNDLLGTGHVFSDEKEILFAPYQELEVSKDASIISRNMYGRYNSEINDFEIKLTGLTKDPKLVKNQKSSPNKIDTYDSKRYGISDSEMDLIVELSKKDDKTQEEIDVLKKLMNKLQNYVMTRCESIRKLYMEKVLAAGNIVTKAGYDNIREISLIYNKNSNIKTEEQIITENDLNSLEEYILFDDDLLSYFYEELNKKGISIESQYETIDSNIVDKVLNSNPVFDDKEVIYNLASKGLIIDEVLVTGNIITRKGWEHLPYVHYCLSDKQIDKETIITEKDYREFAESFPYFDMLNEYSIYTMIDDLNNKGMRFITEEDYKNSNNKNR